MCHHSIVKSWEKCLSNKYFTFSQVSYEEAVNEINKTDISKAYQETDIPMNIIRKNADSFNNLIALITR